uniref:Profilin-like n=1 Tax=Rhizophora mucronata TaxID=61149 RepID=A0A2P2IUC9_RHIMU
MILKFSSLLYHVSVCLPPVGMAECSEIILWGY